MKRRGTLFGHVLRHAVLLAGLVIMLAPFWVSYEIVVRFAGGVFFLTGMILMAYNVWRTVRARLKSSSCPKRWKRQAFRPR